MAKRRRKRCAGVSVGISKAMAKAWLGASEGGPLAVQLDPGGPVLPIAVVPKA